jgi:hypothetical protein
MSGINDRLRCDFDICCLRRGEAEANTAIDFKNGTVIGCTRPAVPLRLLLVVHSFALLSRFLCCFCDTRRAKLLTLNRSSGLFPGSLQRQGMTAHNLPGTVRLLLLPPSSPPSPYPNQARYTKGPDLQYLYLKDARRDQTPDRRAYLEEVQKLAHWAKRYRVVVPRPKNRGLWRERVLKASRLCVLRRMTGFHGSCPPAGICTTRWFVVLVHIEEMTVVEMKSSGLELS